MQNVSIRCCGAPKLTRRLEQNRPRVNVLRCHCRCRAWAFRLIDEAATQLWAPSTTIEFIDELDVASCGLNVSDMSKWRPWKIHTHQRENALCIFGDA
jgi:hypothetical protein